MLSAKLHQFNKNISNLTDQEKDHDSTEISLLEKSIKAKEQIVEHRVRFKNLFNDLNNALMSIKTNGTSKLFVFESVTQADCVISYKTMYNECDGVISCNCNYLMLCGSKMLLISDFKMA